MSLELGGNMFNINRKATQAEVDAEVKKLLAERDKVDPMIPTYSA